MTQYEQRIIHLIYDMVRGMRPGEAINFLWREGLISRKGAERRYFLRETERRFREGGAKMSIIRSLAEEADCSMEKVRAVLYNKKKRETKREKNGDKN